MLSATRDRFLRLLGVFGVDRVQVVCWRFCICVRIDLGAGDREEFAEEESFVDVALSNEVRNQHETKAIGVEEVMYLDSKSPLRKQLDGDSFPN